jgi:hypothetical protein
LHQTGYIYDLAYQSISDILTQQDILLSVNSIRN